MRVRDFSSLVLVLLAVAKPLSILLLYILIR